MRPHHRLFAAVFLAIVFLAPPLRAGTHDAAREAVEMWIATVLSADVEAVAAILAPEFQIVRGSGARYDAAGYVADGLGSAARGDIPIVEDIEATADGDLMVVSYWLVLDVVENGTTLTRRAPRMTVFRQIDGVCRVSAHANFAVPAQ